MREESFATGSIEYPDNVAFVYNPNYIKLVRIYDCPYGSILFANPRTGKTIEISVALMNNMASVYISKFLQILLEDDRSFTLYATIKAGEFETTISFLCINGSLNIGERFGQIGSFVYDPDEKNFVRRVRWFKNFPFEVSIFAENTTTRLTHRYDGNGYSTQRFLGSGFNDLNPKDYAPNAERQVVFKIVPITPDNSSGEGSSTFDATYDYTFKTLLASVSFVRLYVDNSTEGHYFRWIDPLGQIQYFLFTKGVEQIKVTDSQQTEDEVESNGIYFGRIMRTMEKVRTRELKCCAANLTKDEQDYVKTIVSSVRCDMWLGGEIWMPVNVKAGSFSINENDDLQDFEIVAELPISQTQTR